MNPALPALRKPLKASVCEENMQQLTIGPNESGQRLDKYLKKALPNAPMSLLYKQMRNKNLTLNGKKAEGKETLKEGDVVKCFFSEETFARFSGREVGNSRAPEYVKAYQTLKGLKVLYEDGNILLIHKPAGILSQKARPLDASLNEWMIGYLLAKGDLRETDLYTFCPSVCNRLDRNTSGIVICGKSLSGLQAMNRLLKERTLRKFYLTICHGKIEGPKEISGYLIKDPKTNMVRVLSQEAEDADPIRTRYVPLKQAADYTLLEVELITGKTHQIRAQLASAGHALIGDPKYCPEALLKKDRSGFSLKSQLLHAIRLEFPSWEKIKDDLPQSEAVLKPLSGLIVTAPLPETFTRIQTTLFPER